MRAEAVGGNCVLRIKFNTLSNSKIDPRKTENNKPAGDTILFKIGTHLRNNAKEGAGAYKITGRGLKFFWVTGIRILTSKTLRS